MIKRILTIFCAVVFTVAFWQCGSVPATYYYRVHTDTTPATAANAPIPVTLAIGPFDADVVYESDRIVFRNSPYEVQYYHYRRWVAPPAMLVSDAVVNHFKTSGAFENVQKIPLESQADYLLSGKILAFEEWDESDSWYGSVKIAFELHDTKNNEVIWQKTYSERRRTGNKEPVEVVKAISDGLDAVISSALSDITSALKMQ